MCGGFDFRFLRGGESRRGDDDGKLALDARLQYPQGPVGHREIDNHIDAVTKRNRDGDRNTKRAEARQIADVAALPRIARRIEGGAELERLVFMRQLNHALAHAAASAVDGEDG